MVAEFKILWYIDKSRITIVIKFETVGPDTGKLRDLYHNSRERSIFRSPSEHDHSHERPDAVDIGMHVSVTYDGAVRQRHLLTNIRSLNRIHCTECQ